MEHIKRIRKAGWSSILSERWLRSLRLVAKNFLWNRSANIAIATALLAVPIIATAGLAVDLSLALNEKTKLQAMADVRRRMI